jgi:hypothetical protein
MQPLIKKTIKEKNDIKGEYTFQFSYLGSDGKEVFEMAIINDPMNVEEAVKMAYKHAREFPYGRVNTFASNSMLLSLNQAWEERVRVGNVELLNEYSDWLHENNYIDADYYAEEPRAVDEFLKSKK